MIKIIFTMHRKIGTSRDAFIEHYELRHVPLVLSFIPPPTVYRRNYLQDCSDEAFDVVTEVIHAAKADARHAKVIMSRPEVVAAIRADEYLFIELDSVRSYLVETYDSGQRPIVA
jgi:EthD domain